jgi:hypothetical protein
MALSCALAAAVAIPAAATALPKFRGLGGTATQSQVAARQANRETRIANRAKVLEAKIAMVLARRTARFDRVSGRLTTRIAKVGSIIDRVAEAGGDVAASRKLLDSAKAHLSKGSDLEANAIAAFKEIPQAADKRAAFMAARDIARSAGDELRSAKTDLRSSVVEVRSTITQLRSQASTSTETN